MSKDIEEGKVCAILAYLLIGIIWYFADEKMKKNAYARFHAQQGLVLLIVCIGYWIVSWTIMMPFRFIPFLGAVVGMALGILGLAIFVLAIMGIVYAATGKEKELPVIGSYGKKLNI